MVPRWNKKVFFPRSIAPLLFSRPISSPRKRMEECKEKVGLFLSLSRHCKGIFLCRVSSFLRYSYLPEAFPSSASTQPLVYMDFLSPAQMSVSQWIFMEFFPLCTTKMLRGDTLTEGSPFLLKAISQWREKEKFHREGKSWEETKRGEFSDLWLVMASFVWSAPQITAFFNYKGHRV